MGKHLVRMLCACALLVTVLSMNACGSSSGSSGGTVFPTLSLKCGSQACVK